MALIDQPDGAPTLGQIFFEYDVHILIGLMLSRQITLTCLVEWNVIFLDLGGFGVIMSVCLCLCVELVL